jgi:hypothetical protein
VAFAFISTIVIVSIRKKKENNFSVLLRIFTNYAQLLTASLSFDTNLPDGFINIFSLPDRFTAPNESFFSFD